MNTQPVPTATDITLPPVPEGYEAVCKAADAAMWHVLEQDLLVPISEQAHVNTKHQEELA